VSFSAGETLFEQGDFADRFYLLRSGEVAILIDGNEVVRTGPGGHFGEIGLLQGIARTATVRATRDGEALALGHEAFNLLAVEADMTHGELVKLMMKRELLNTLGAVLPDADLAALSEAGAVAEDRWYDDGDVIITQGDRADGFYILQQGTVEVLSDHAAGSAFVVATMDALDYFGEIGLLEGRPRTASVRAVGTVRTLFLERTAFEVLLGDSEATRHEVAQVASSRLVELVAQGR